MNYGEESKFMTGFTKQEAQKVVLGPYLDGQVSYCNGDVTAYHGFNLPAFLQSPLRGGVLDYNSLPSIQLGGRSDLIYNNPVWFKLKGDKPTGRSLADAFHRTTSNDWMNETPEGGMTEMCARREIEVSDIIEKKCASMVLMLHILQLV